jgi:tetratricopeptide (TPR) repeat protein
MNRCLCVLAVPVLVILTFLTYLPALRNGFIWDDNDHFTENPAMTRPDGLQKIWSSLTVSRYYPLTLTSFWVQRRLWGLNPLAYHAVNIGLHALNAVLVLLLLRRLKVPGAWAAAALWAVHPVNVESVAWATELKNIQSGVFFFLSLLCFLRHERRPQGGWYAPSLVAFAAALVSKPSTVILPLILLLLAWWQRGRVQRQDLRRAAPFFALALAMSLLTIAEQHGHIERAPHDWSLSLTERFTLAGKALWFYGGKVLCPVNLMFVYPRWALDADSWLSWLPLVAAVAVAIRLWQLRRHGWANASLFGLGYFVIALLPVLGFFDIYYFRYSFVGDHFQYLASIGPLALLAAGATTVLHSRRTQVTAATVAVVALGVVSWRYTHVFHDDETLWRDTLAGNPQAVIAHNNLGIIFDTEGRYKQGAEQFREALAIKPDYLEAHSNLGLALTELGRYPEAEQELRQALTIKPDFSKAHDCLGRLYYRMNQMHAAAYHFAAAVRSEPGMAEAHYNLGCVWLQLDDRLRAIACFRNALLIRPDYPEAHNNLGSLLAEEGNLQEAVQHYQAALNIRPNYGQAHYNLGVKLAEMNHPDQAIEHLRQAIRLMRSFPPDGYIQLAKVLSQKDRFAEAIAVLKSGLNTNSPDPFVANEYAWLLATCPVAELRDPPQAIEIGEALVKATARKIPGLLDTLAAAYAEAGRFDEAVVDAREALALAQSKNDTNLATQLAARVALYEKRQPFRIGSP